MKPFWGRGRVGGTDFQDLRDECWIAGNPVAHDDLAAGLGDADHFFGDVERLGGEHRAEDADGEVEGLIWELMEIGGIAFLEAAVGQA